MNKPKTKMRPIAIIIQARMSSTRLPGKALADIAGQPALGHVFARAKKSKKADLIILATTTKEEDQALIKLAKKYGIKTFAGSENDVLDRYYQAAKKFKVKTIVRLTGDCPLLDPLLIDKALDIFLKAQGKLDFVAFDPSYPDGLDFDIFSFKALARAWQEAKLPSEREHVAPFIYKNPNPKLFKVKTIKPHRPSLNHLRWTLDESADLVLIRKIYALAAQKKWRMFHMKDILKLYRANPELSAINPNIIRNEGYQKSLQKDHLLLDFSKNKAQHSASHLKKKGKSMKNEVQTKFVAEVSSNHNNDLNRCLEFVDKVAAIGCWGIKFQLFKIDELFAPEILAKSATHRKRRQWELPVEFLPAIAKRCREKNIKFGCTPFYLKAVEELEPYVDFYKVASYELPWLDLHRACARTGKPVVFSTGISFLNEVQAAVNALVESGCEDITVLHCTSAYPTPVNECNLAAIETMRSQVKVPREVNLTFGWSDHSVSPKVVYRAITKWEARMVEFHFDLEGKGEEAYIGHCWLPNKIGPVISDISNGVRKDDNYGSEADGNGVKEPIPSELPERPWRADPSDGLRPFKEIRKTWDPKKSKIIGSKPEK